LLILEDLDSILDDDNRSYFLNELDGFAANEGIMTVATTNHPERLDPAILDRPSRFDRKYTFNLPDEPSRVAYLTLQNAGLEPALKLSDAEIAELAVITEDFSYAYLKELVLSSMMKWISGSGSLSMASAMRSQLESLKVQMQTPEPEAGPNPPAPRIPDYMARWRRGNRRR
jgi:ATP-dependent 26S proteasome regulatory subunit